VEAKGRGCRTVVRRGQWRFFVVGGVKGGLEGCFGDFMFRVLGFFGKGFTFWVRGYVILVPSSGYLDLGRGGQHSR